MIDVKSELSYDNLKDLSKLDRFNKVMTTYCEAAKERKKVLIDNIQDNTSDVYNTVSDDELELWDVDGHSSKLSDEQRDNYLTEYREYSTICEAMSFDAINNDNDTTLSSAFDSSYTQWDELDLNTRRSTPLGRPLKYDEEWDDGISVVDGNTAYTDSDSVSNTSIDKSTIYSITSEVSDILSDFKSTEETPLATEDIPDSSEVLENLVTLPTTSNIELSTSIDSVPTLENLVEDTAVTADDINLSSSIDKLEDIEIVRPEIDNLVNDKCDGYYDVLLNKTTAELIKLLKASKIDSKTMGVTIAQTLNDTLNNTLNFELQSKSEENSFNLSKMEIKLKENEQIVDTAVKEKELEFKSVELKMRLLELPYKLAESKAKVLNEIEDLKYKKLAYRHELYKIEETEQRIKYNEIKLREEVTNYKLKRVLDVYTTKLERVKVEDILKTSAVNRDKLRSDVLVSKGSIANIVSGINYNKWKIEQIKNKVKEDNLTGEMNRRVLFSEVSVKNKQASLYDGQRKGFIQKHQEEILKIGRDVWTAQLDAVGVENMLVEGVKGAEFSSRLESAFLSANL